MVKDHSDSERGNPLPPHRLLIRLAARVILYASPNRHDNTYHGLCYTSLGTLAGTSNSSIGSTVRNGSDDPSHHERTLLPRIYISAPENRNKTFQSVFSFKSVSTKDRENRFYWRELASASELKKNKEKKMSP